MSAIHEIATTKPAVYAFEIDGEVSRSDMSDMAERMNGAFAEHDTVDMLLIFRNYGGAEDWASFSWEAIKARAASLAKVGRYYVVGAPDEAARMIEGLGSVIPVEAETYPADQEDQAWADLDARPADTGSGEG